MPKLSNNHNIPNAVSNLRLCSALSNCGHIPVKKAIKKSTACSLYVYDDAALGYSDWTNSQPVNFTETFHIENSNNIEIVLLPLDHRIITGSKIIQGGICDCALLTMNKLCLVEFKTNVKTGLNMTLEARCLKASKQILHTINGIIRPRCKQKCIDIDKKVHIEAYIVFDKELNVTGAQTIFQSIAMEILEKNKLPLYIDNETKFP